MMKTMLSKKNIDIKQNDGFNKVYFTKTFSDELSTDF